MTNDEMVKSWLRLAKDPRTSPSDLEKAAYWESLNTPNNFDIRFWVASNPNCQSDLLATLSLVKNLKVLIQVAGHRRLREDTAGKLLKSHLRNLRRSLAANGSIPVYVMTKLAKDFEDVRESLARNPSLVPKLVKQLAHEKNPKIRASLARNTRISIAAFRFLQKDSNAHVRASLVTNHVLPYETLYDLCQDSEEEVRSLCLDKAIEEYPHDLALFEILSSFEESETARQAAEYLVEYKVKKEANEEGEEV